MLIKNNIAAVIVSLGYILFSETLISILQYIGSVSTTTTRIVQWYVKHSIYGMSSVVTAVSATPTLIIINSFSIATIATVAGMWFFRKHEL